MSLFVFAITALLVIGLSLASALAFWIFRDELTEAIMRDDR